MYRLIVFQLEDLVEDQSDDNQEDRYRMLLQAAYVARLGRLSYNNPFIVMALYIENSGRVTQYFLFQRDGAHPSVCTFEFKQSFVFSLVHLNHLGFLCLGRPRLDATVRFVYCYV